MHQTDHELPEVAVSCWDCHGASAAARKMPGQPVIVLVRPPNNRCSSAAIRSLAYHCCGCPNSLREADAGISRPATPMQRGGLMVSGSADAARWTSKQLRTGGVVMLRYVVLRGGMLSHLGFGGRFPSMETRAWSGSSSVWAPFGAWPGNNTRTTDQSRRADATRFSSLYANISHYTHNNSINRSHCI